MTDSGLRKTFEQDTKNFINQITEGVIKLENEGFSSELINHIFRCIHSIKSEAAYLSLGVIADAAHNMESAIEPFRHKSPGGDVDPDLIKFCFAGIDKIKKNLNENGMMEGGMEESVIDDTGKVPGYKVAEQLAVDVTERLYSEFEKMLLTEARTRGERLYFLSFRISDDEAMKYPRAYLAVSNLEQRVNVIRVNPAPEELDSSGGNMITVFLSTAKDEKQILAEINIDQIVDVKLEKLSFEFELGNVDTAEKPAEKVQKAETDRTISVEAKEIEAISGYVGEIKKRLSDLSSVVMDGSGETGFENKLSDLEVISASIENMMTNLKTVDFNKQFAGYKRIVRDISVELGKKVELMLNSDNIRVKRDFAEFVAEPLLQIIRNAVVHGIEKSGERAVSGKDIVGSIKVRAFTLGEQLIISVEDDGAGIDIAALSGDTGDITTDEQLLELLIQPGYTTLPESGKFGGRGVGLDLVANRIKERGGYLELHNIPGTSCVFSMIFPLNRY